MAEINSIDAEQFQQLNNRLDRLEQIGLAQKNVLNFEEFCTYVGISKSYGYKLTSLRKVPHSSPNGKMLFFERSQVDFWLLQNPIKTQKQLKSEITK